MSDPRRQRLLELILEVSFRRGRVVLKSGRESDFYLDLRQTLMLPRGAHLAGELMREALRALARFVPQRVGAGDLLEMRELWGAVYLLTDLEADGNAISLSPHDEMMVWSEGTRSKATLNSISQYHPGDFREMALSLEEPLTSMEGSRILLLSGERVVGLGAITQIGH